MAGMSFAIALTDEQWELVADLFDPPGRRGAPAQIPRHQMVDAMLFIGQTGCQWLTCPSATGSGRRSGPSGDAALERRLGAGDGAPRGDRPRAPRSRVADFRKSPDSISETPQA